MSLIPGICTSIFAFLTASEPGVNSIGSRFFPSRICTNARENDPEFRGKSREAIPLNFVRSSPAGVVTSRFTFLAEPPAIILVRSSTLIRILAASIDSSESSVESFRPAPLSSSIVMR